MNQKFLINIRQPTSGASCDAYVPADVRCDCLVKALGVLMEEMSDHEYVREPNALLWSESVNGFLDLNRTAAENGLTNGDRWILI